MAIVYVVQESNLNLAKATKYGQLKCLLPGHKSVVMSTQPIIRELKTNLKDFCDDDYLLLLGDPVAIGLATTIAFEMNNGRVKFLKFDRELPGYFEVIADLHDRLREDA